MKRFISLAVLFFCLFFVSCSKDDNSESINQHTLIVYMPWSNLYNAFLQNLEDLETAIATNDMSNQRVIVFLASGQKTATMYEITVQNKVCHEVTKKSYSFETADFTTVSGLTSILTDAITYAPAKEYSLIIGCHGMGWLPVTRNSNGPTTRWFGGTTSTYQTEISTLHQALSNMNIKLQFLLFDDCYMANAETAYELKDVTNYLIGSTCEIMSYGMPYQKIGKCLLGNPDYERICEEFLDFYQNEYSYHYGTISVINMSQMENLAQEMKALNSKYTFDTSLTYSIQRMDGYAQPIFLDLGDYIDKLVQDESVEASIRLQLEKTVPYRAHTDQFYTMTGSMAYDIKTYSGLTVSDPSPNPETDTKTSTAWWAATH